MKSILSAWDIPIRLTDDRIFVAIENGTVNVMIKIAKFRLMTKPMLKKVALNPDAIPLLSAGTELMIELTFGETNAPQPIPKLTK